MKADCFAQIKKFLVSFITIINYLQLFGWIFCIFKYNSFLYNTHINGAYLNWLSIKALHGIFAFFKFKCFLIDLRAWSLFWTLQHNLSMCLLKFSSLSIISPSNSTSPNSPVVKVFTKSFWCWYDFFTEYRELKPFLGLLSWNWF